MMARLRGQGGQHRRGRHQLTVRGGDDSLGAAPGIILLYVYTCLCCLDCSSDADASPPREAHKGSVCKGSTASWTGGHTEAPFWRFIRRGRHSRPGGTPAEVS